MTRTHATPLIALALVGVVVGFLLEVAAAAFGFPHIVPPVSLPITLVAVGVVVVVLAWPIRQATRAKGTARKPVNPFVAMRIAVLAKASSFSGALLLGGGGGIVLYIFTRSVAPAVTSLWLAIAMALGAALLLAGGLIAEHFCALPPSDDDQNEHGATHV